MDPDESPPTPPSHTDSAVSLNGGSDVPLPAVPNGIARSHSLGSQGVVEAADLRLPSVSTAIPRKSVAGKSGAKKPFAALRHKWLRMDEDGDTAEVALGKHALMHRLGVQIRDLRLLDAQPASSPPAILCRDQAIVVNLEFIKCIITTRYVLIMQTGQEQVAAFVGEHQRRLKDPAGTGDMPMGNGEVGGKLPELAGIAEEMPFELKVMEVVLDFVMAYLEFLTSNLEATAHPILDSIVHKVTRRNLEQLRTIKTRMVRLFTKVETIRELLERLLDDDDDMRDMNLTAKARNAARVQKLRLELEGEAAAAAARDYRRSPSLEYSKSGAYDAYDKEGEEEREKDQVEQVLETYFMNLDNTYNKLQTLGEYVDDTEDYVRFEIDTQRNRFIEYRLVLQMFTFTCHVIANVANVFTMNIGIGEDTIGTGDTFRDSYAVFVVTSVVTSLGSMTLLGLLFLFMRQKRMLCY